jgi:hypothetical protein
MNMLIKLTPGGADKELKLNYLNVCIDFHQTLVHRCSIIIRWGALYTGLFVQNYLKVTVLCSVL